VDRIGILGGTFNPPHLGHLALARHARETLGLDRVFLMPAREPPHKREAPDPGPQHRLAMCRLLTEDEPAVAACALETERAGPSYTVDTLRELHARWPEVQLTFIAGSDAAHTLSSWREPEALLALAEWAIAARPGADADDALRAVAAAGSVSRGAPDGDGAAGVRLLEMEPLEVSSSAARERAARGEAIEGLVGEAIAAYIAEHGLYGAGGGLDTRKGSGGSAPG
jgi:nicotinate-nucleotide adenylyltransferase